MNALMNMRLGARLGAGFAILVALLIGIVVVGLGRIEALDLNTEVIVHDRLVKIELAHQVENEVNRQSRAIRTALIAQDAGVVTGELAKIEDSSHVVAKALEQLEATIHTEQGKAALKALLEGRATFRDYEHQLVG